MSTLSLCHKKIVDLFAIVFLFYLKLFRILKGYVLFIEVLNEEHRRKVTLVFIGLFLLFMASFFIELLSNLAASLGITILILLSLDVVPAVLYRACQSLCGCTCLLLIVNVIVAAIVDISFLYFAAGKTDLYFKHWLIIYSFFWISFSLLAETQVAKLANEIISGLNAFVFTLLSYYISLVSDKDIFSFFSKITPESSNYIWQLYEEMTIGGYSLTRLLVALTGVLLPFIGLSCISIVILNLKQYWTQKYDKMDLFEEAFKDKFFY